MASIATTFGVIPGVSDGLRFGISKQTQTLGVASLPKRVRLTTKLNAGINPGVRKDENKVVDSVEVAELSKPLTAYCRCWRSETFPLCDGTHAKHNKETGDNVGPLLLKKPKE